MNESNLIESFELPKIINFSKFLNYSVQTHSNKKCNVDGASRGSHGVSTCGCFFRSHLGVFISVFSTNICIANSLHDEIKASIYSTEIAHSKNWNNSRLKSDYLLTIQDFSDINIVFL